MAAGDAALARMAAPYRRRNRTVAASQASYAIFQFQAPVASEAANAASLALRRTAASTRRPRSRSVKSWRAALTTAEATTAVARIGSGTAVPSMRDSVMGEISRRAGTGRAARRALKTAARQTLPGPALPLPAILLMREEERTCREGCEAASAAPQRSVIRQRRPVSARSRRPRPPAPRRRRENPAALFLRPPGG